MLAVFTAVLFPALLWVTDKPPATPAGGMIDHPKRGAGPLMCLPRTATTIAPPEGAARYRYTSVPETAIPAFRLLCVTTPAPAPRLPGGIEPDFSDRVGPGRPAVPSGSARCWSSNDRFVGGTAGAGGTAESVMVTFQLGAPVVAEEPGSV